MTLLLRMCGRQVLGKRLTELMVRDAHRESGVPIAIVRPSLVTSLAGRPYPGYVGNLAGAATDDALRGQMAGMLPAS